MTGHAHRLPGVRCVQHNRSCRLWMVELDGSQEAGQDVLSAAEKTRALRFVFKQHQQRYIQAHSTLRQLLGELLGAAPGTLRIAEGVHGKPYLVDWPQCHFNLTHSASMALVGVSMEAEIGVDLEQLRPVDDLPALCATSFTINEQKALCEVTAEGVDDMFLRGWTRKEACLKAMGKGLLIAPNTFEAGFWHDAVVHITDAAATHAVTLHSVDAGPGWLAACAQLH